MSNKEEPARHFRDIKVTAEASSIEKWRKQVIAGQPESGSAFALICD
jgi:ubiquitin